MGNGKDKKRLNDLEAAVANGELTIESDDIRARRLNTLRWLDGWEELPDPLPTGVLFDERRHTPYVTATKDGDDWVTETRGLTNSEVGERYTAENLPWPLPTGRIALDSQGRPYLRSQGPEGRGGEKLSVERVWKIFRNEIRDLARAPHVSFTEFPEQAPPGVKYFGSGEKRTAWLMGERNERIRELSKSEVWQRVEAVAQTETVQVPPATSEPTPAPTLSSPAEASQPSSPTAPAEQSTPPVPPIVDAEAAFAQTDEYDEIYRLVVAWVNKRSMTGDEDRMKELQPHLSYAQITRLFDLLPVWRESRPCRITGEPFVPYVSRKTMSQVRLGKNALVRFDPPTVSKEGLQQQREAAKQPTQAVPEPSTVAVEVEETPTPHNSPGIPSQPPRSTKTRRQRGGRATEKRADNADMHRPAEPDVDPRDQRRHRQPAATTAKSAPTVAQPDPSRSTPASATPPTQVSSSPVLSSAEEAAAEEMTQAAQRMRERTAALRARLAS